MKPNWTAYLLLAAGAGLIWWRMRADSQAGTPSVDWEGLQKTVSAFQPEGVDLNERTLADGIPAAASALSSLGMGGWLESPDGRLVLTSDKNLAASITAARTPILPSAPAAKPKPRKTIQKNAGLFWYWVYADDPNQTIHWGMAPKP